MAENDQDTQSAEATEPSDASTIEYIVNYEIPGKLKEDEEKPTGETMQGAIRIVVGEERAGEYREVYARLNRIGHRYLTSSYRVRFGGSAEELREYALEGLDADVAARI